MPLTIKELKEKFSGKTCVVVFSNQKTLGHEYGPWIDSHDVVLRVNWVDLDEKENSFGSRTDLWVNGALPPRYKAANKFLVDVPEISINQISPLNRLNKPDFIHIGRKIQMALNQPNFLKTGTYSYDNRMNASSTGFAQVVIGIEIFGKVDLVGQDKNLQDGYVNAFSKHKNTVNQGNKNFLYETECLKRLHSNGFIKEWKEI